MESDATGRVGRQSCAGRVVSDGEILNIADGELNACDVGWPSSWMYTHTTKDPLVSPTRRVGIATIVS